MGQFADLSGIQLAGKIDGTFGWQTAPSATPAVANKPIQIGGTFLITDPVIKFPELPVWQQKELSVKLSAAGQSNSDQNIQRLQLDQGGIQVNIGTEQAIATLETPLQDAFVDPWPMNCHITGNLGGWVRHIQNFVDLGDIGAAGSLDLTCNATLQGSD